MKKIKIVKANKNHKEFLIKANSIIHNISEQLYQSDFAQKLEHDYYTKKPKFYCLVAEYNSMPIGMLLYSKMYWADDGEVLWVSQMYVEKEYRKFSVAAKLYEALKIYNPECNVISCVTGKNNVLMNKVLNGFGFNIIDMNFYAKKIK